MMLRWLKIKLLRVIHKNVDAFARARSGMAAVEFALILPVIILLFFGMLESSDALTVKRRVDNASNALVDLVGQATEVSATELQDIFTGIEKMIEGNEGSSLAIKVTSVIRDPDDTSRVIVHWSRDDDMNEPYNAGSVFTGLENETILKANMSILVVEVDFDYTSSISSRVIGQPISISKKAARLPRRSAKVTFCPDSTPDNCIT